MANTIEANNLKVFLNVTEIHSKNTYMEMKFAEISDYDMLRNYGRIKLIEFLNSVRNGIGFPPQDIFTLFIVVYCTVGCIGNILICYVIISFKYMRTSVNMYLLSLAISDCLILVTLSFKNLYCLSVGRVDLFEFDFSFMVTSIVHFTASSNSKLATVVITVDRYIAVCHPLIGRQIFNISRTVKIILLLWIMSLLHGLAFVLCTSLKYASQCSALQIFVSAEFLFIVHFFIPMLIIIALYTLIVCQIWRSTHLRGSSRNRNSRSCKNAFRKKLNISVAVVVEFFICFGPINILVFLIKYNIIERAMSGRAYIFLLGVLLYILSTLINPIIYFVLSSKFRNAFKVSVTTAE